MYKEVGRYQSEWDGIFYATHSAVKLPRLFFVETKQIMSLANYKDAKTRLSKTKRFLGKIKWDDVEATGGVGNDFTAMKGIFRVFFTSLPKIELVVGSPFVEAALKLKSNSRQTAFPVWLFRRINMWLLYMEYIDGGDMAFRSYYIPIHVSR